MYVLLYIFYDSLSSATVQTPNPAFENGRADPKVMRPTNTYNAESPYNALIRVIFVIACN